MKLKLLLIGSILSVAFSNSYGQCKETTWPEEKQKAEECVAIWGDAMRQGNHRAATSSLQWMMNKAPKWNTKLYIDAADVYDKLAEKETDAAKKKVLVDSLLLIYDLRIQNCGDEVNVFNRKVFASYKYNYKAKDQLPALLAAFDKVYEISGNNVSDGNLVAYMTVVKNYQTLYKNLTDEQVLQRYDKIMTVTDAKLKKALEQAKQADVDKYKSYKDAVDGILIQIVKVDCDFVKKNLAPKFKANPTDLPLAKKIFKFMLDGKCTEDPLWLEAGEAIYKLNPEKDFGLLKTLAAKHMINNNFDKAESLLKEALALPSDAAGKSEAQQYMGSIFAKKGDYSGARDWFRQAAASNPSNKEAWEKIGDLYYNSFDNCAKKVNLAEDRLVYIAAYEMYQKAGNAQLMQRAKAQFPSKEEIFLLNWQKGSTQQVKCWIGESVVLNTRD